MRAVVDDPELLDSAGLNPHAVRRVAWMIGSCLAAASGVLFAPLLPLDPVQLTLLVVAAFGAAAVGGFRSLALTYVGGLAIGVLASLATRYLTSGLLAGISPSLPFLVLFLVLLVFPRSRMIRPPVRPMRLSVNWHPAPRMIAPFAAAVLVVLLVVPSFAGIHLTDWTTALATALIFLSLGLLVETSGQVSLCQVSFAAIGATGFSHFAVGHHLPWLIALLLAGLVAVPIGALLAIPAVRLSGLYLALATFGFGILLQYMFYTESYMFGANGAGVTEPRPHLSFLTLDSDRGFYYVVLVVLVVATGGIALLNRSRLGRLLRGGADASVTLQTSGSSVRVTRVIVFCLAAFLAAIGGALAGAAQSTSSAESYPPLLSLTYLTLIVVVGLRAPWNALVAAAALVLVPSYLTGANVPTYLQLIFGASAVLVAVTRAPSIRWLNGRLGGRAAAAPEPEPITAPAAAASARAGVTPGALEIHGLTVRFGAVAVLNGLDLVARTGEITGLIGPNGAGKTTTFNACTGLVRPDSGHVALDGRDITRLGSAARARRGLGRTFQQMQLFDSTTVRENVALGAEAGFADANPLHHLAATPGQRQELRTRTDDALELCGLQTFADHPVRELSTGQRRLVDLARCLAGRYRILLLDEPSSGLDSAETAEFATIVRRVVAELGVGILLVEHDLSLVLDVCSSIYVLDFGQLLFTGTPSEVAASPVVRAAYLGEAAEELTQALTPAVSGAGA
jgi:ABC-type branched-subunit amino acid transport system ATPase component/ABC-type branched-subunit amino acid transport system permease subunit